jgi:hypothetical protein
MALAPALLLAINWSQPNIETGEMTMAKKQSHWIPLGGDYPLPPIGCMLLFGFRRYGMWHSVLAMIRPDATAEAMEHDVFTHWAMPPAWAIKGA